VPCRRLILWSVITALAPAVAQAQFTTFIPPHTADSVKAAVVASQQKTTDSAAKSQITDLKTWVDSASGVVPPGTAPDSVARATQSDTTTFRSGSRAPATASSLPLLALVGAGSLLLGALLLNGRPAAHRGA